jgi:hypothetical protein
MLCNTSYLVFTLSVSFVRGTHTRRMAQSAGRGRRISFVWASTQGRQPASSAISLHTFSG